MSREDEYAHAAQALPTPTDTPYRTPARSLSRRSSRHSSRHCTSSPGPSSSPPPFPPGGDSYFGNHGGSKDFANDETISILDPRRFTPTLHASLVSEILSLRRDQESRTSLIETLESSLHTARIENENITEILTSNANKARALERQLQALEGGSSSAFDELAKERDEALTSLSDARQRLEVSQAKIRSQEEEDDRTHALWERDRQTWEGERRNLERKVHVVEGRLKTVLAEIAAAQADGLYHDGDFDAEEAAENRGLGGEGDRNSIRANSVLDRRPMSGMSNSTHNGDVHNIRLSMLSGPNGYGGMKASGRTLADELGFDEEEEDMLDDSDLEDGQVSPDALPEERLGRTSVLSVREDQKARKVLGLPHEREFAVAKVWEASTTEKTGIFDGSEKSAAVLELRHRDTDIQYSPPPSPRAKPKLEELNGDEAQGDRVPPPLENGANQSRKRASVSAVPPIDQYNDLSSTQRSIAMVSSPTQTSNDLPCPSCIYKGALENVVASHSLRAAGGVMSSSSTQTEESQEQQTTAVPNSTECTTSQFAPIPIITIHPPVSAPSSPRTSVVLPPHTKSTACQASIVPSVKLRSISVQTEEIRIDNRAGKLPENLHPSAISSQPPTPHLSDIENDNGSPISNEAIIHIFRTSLQKPPPDRTPPPKPVQSPVEPEEAYPGNNDNGPLNGSNDPPIRRPFRSSSLFAGFDLPSDEAGGKAETDFSDDDDFRNAAPIRKTLSKVQNSWKLVPQQKENVFESRDIPELDEEAETAHDDKETGDTSALQESQTVSADLGPSATSQPTTRPLDSTPRWGNIAKQPNIRKTALISSGTAAHLQRSRSPSLPSTNSSAPTTSAPPFPVPMRSSSRKIPLSASDGAQSPTPYSGGMFPGDRRRDPGRAPSKKPMMRKVRSAAAMPRGGNQGRSLSQSPPPILVSAVPESPKLPRLPPMPRDDKTSSRHGQVARPYQHEQQLSTSNSDAGNTVVDSSIQQTTVVDAIAQTMVGEWMWKYVRKRKSFGVAESPQADWEISRNAADGSASVTGSGIRHKRWVWLAPYERAVMWSSKQPTSGSALLGKSGRKLMIQSVLDVKDDTPYPKGSGPQQHLNRSILILTPQRALKFTATSKERHYTWLTALSFLSHSTLGVHDLDSQPVMPLIEYEPPPRHNPGTLRRNPIRDSIRVAKGKARPNVNPARAYTSPGGSVRQEWSQASDLHYATQEEGHDAAEPPHVPRFSNHGRKRSNTGPRQPTGPFRNITNHSAFTSNHSLHTATSGDTTHNAPSFFSGMRHGSSAQSSLSPRTSEASGGGGGTGGGGGPPSGIIVNNFFDAVGTVRMEAFVEPRPIPRKPDAPPDQDKRPARRSYRTRQGRKKDLEYWGVRHGHDHGLRVEEGGDPFRGF